MMPAFVFHGVFVASHTYTKEKQQGKETIGK